MGRRWGSGLGPGAFEELGDKAGVGSEAGLELEMWGLACTEVLRTEASGLSFWGWEVCIGMT